MFTGSELVAAGAGSVVTLIALAVASWIWWHFAPPPGADRSRDARDYARQKLKGVKR